MFTVTEDKPLVHETDTWQRQTYDEAVRDVDARVAELCGLGWQIDTNHVVDGAALYGFRLTLRDRVRVITVTAKSGTSRRSTN